MGYGAKDCSEVVAKLYEIFCGRKSSEIMRFCSFTEEQQVFCGRVWSYR
jgi:hypothetical protein